MNPVVFLVTSSLLGFMVVAAGAYALLYGAARFRESRALLIAAGLAYAMLALDAAGIVLATPLASPWKLLIAASALAYFAIPPLTWRYLLYTHREEGTHP
jgi:uncharacterized membrane protein YgdD (TMEM256/DUF423 family)